MEMKQATRNQQKSRLRVLYFQKTWSKCHKMMVYSKQELFQFMYYTCIILF